MWLNIAGLRQAAHSLHLPTNPGQGLEFSITGQLPLRPLLRPHGLCHRSRHREHGRRRCRTRLCQSLQVRSHRLPFRVPSSTRRPRPARVAALHLQMQASAASAHAQHRLGRLPLERPPVVKESAASCLQRALLHAGLRDARSLLATDVDGTATAPAAVRAPCLDAPRCEAPRSTRAQ